jgi:predicted RNA binding protein YcfA (HicA-like mRNA interferase family)
VTKLRVVPYRTLRKVVERAGFQWLRCEGSHNVFRNDAGATVVVPDHGSMVIVRPLLRKILRDLGISVEEYERILDDL